jgi:hypothetical protein
MRSSLPPTVEEDILSEISVSRLTLAARVALSAIGKTFSS